MGETLRPRGYIDLRQRSFNAINLQAIPCFVVALASFLLFGLVEFNVHNSVLSFLLELIITAPLVGSVVLFVTLLFGFCTPYLTFDCPHCGKSHPIRREWICGFCDTENDPTLTPLGKPSILDRCSSKACITRPKAYQCDHCDKPIYLDLDCDDRHAARGMGKTPVTPTYQEQQEIPKKRTYEEQLAEIHAAKMEQEKEAEITQLKIALARGEQRQREQNQLLNKLNSPDFWGDRERGSAFDEAAVMKAQEAAARKWAAEQTRIATDPELDEDMKRDLIDFGRSLFNAGREARKADALKRPHEPKRS